MWRANWNTMLMCDLMTNITHKVLFNVISIIDYTLHCLNVFFLLFSSKQRVVYSQAVRAGLMELWKNNFEAGGPWGWLYIIFPPQCECIIVWAVAVINDNRGWHWEVPEFSCLKMSLGCLWQNATQREGSRYDKTTTLKCCPSLCPSHTFTHSWECDVHTHVRAHTLFNIDYTCELLIQLTVVFEWDKNKQF